MISFTRLIESSLEWDGVYNKNDKLTECKHMPLYLIPTMKSHDLYIWMATTWIIPAVRSSENESRLVSV